MTDINTSPSSINTTISIQSPDLYDQLPSLEHDTSDNSTTHDENKQIIEQSDIIDLLDDVNDTVESNQLTTSDYYSTADELEVISCNIPSKPNSNTINHNKRNRLDQIDLLQQIIDSITNNTVRNYNDYTINNNTEHDINQSTVNNHQSTSISAQQQLVVNHAIRTAVMAANETLQQRKQPKILASIDLSDDTNDKSSNHTIQSISALPVESTNTTGTTVSPIIPDNRDDIVDMLRANITCPVCLEKNFPKILSTTCGHIFCEPCIKLCVRLHRKCAKCNTKLTPKDLHQVYF